MLFPFTLELFPFPFLFPLVAQNYSHSHGNPMGITWEWEFPFPCTPLSHSYFISSSQILVILCKSLHVDEISSRSSAYIRTPNINTSNVITTSRGRTFTHNIIDIYGKENRWEHCRWFARLDFWRSCLRLMTSRNTAVYRYNGISWDGILSSGISNTAHP